MEATVTTKTQPREALRTRRSHRPATPDAHPPCGRLQHGQLYVPPAGIVQFPWQESSRFNLEESSHRDLR